MNPYLLPVLLLLSNPLWAQGPFGANPKNSSSTKTYNLGRQDNGVWFEVGKSGTGTPIRIDPNTSTLPVYASINELRDFSGTSAPKSVILTDKYRTGIYLLNRANTSSPDNGGTVLVSASGLRYELQYNNEVSVVQFGATPSDGTDDTDAFRRAFAAKVPLVVPVGNYDLYDSLAVVNDGQMRIRGLTPYATLTMHADKNLLVFVSNAPGGEIVDIRDLTLSAAVQMTNGAAITIRGGYVQKLGTVTGITVTRNSGLSEWRWGVRVENPAELVMRDVIVRGNGPTNLFAYDISSTVASVSSSFQNLKAYDCFTGLRIRNNSIPGLEGLKIYGCDFVGVEWGIDAVSTVDAGTYIPPGLQVDLCHINSTYSGINVQKFSQVFVTNSIIYMSGGSFNIGLQAANVSQMTMADNKFFNVGSGLPYAVLLNAGTNIDVDIHHNYFSLRPGGTEQAIWFGPTTTYSQATDNQTVGLSGNTYATGEGGCYNENGTNTIRNNTIRN